MEKDEKKPKRSVYKTLSSIDVSEYIETKGGLSYLPWAWCWIKVKENYPEASFKVYENSDGWNYHTDGNTCWVKTGVTIEGQELIEHLAIMDFRNTSIPVDKVKSTDVVRSIQRCLTKACARHGLGLYVYAGEDLPEASKELAKQTSEEDIPKAIEELKACTTGDEASAVWSKWRKIHPEYCRPDHPFYKEYSNINLF